MHTSHITVNAYDSLQISMTALDWEWHCTVRTHRGKSDLFFTFHQTKTMKQWVTVCLSIFGHWRKAASNLGNPPQSLGSVAMETLVSVPASWIPLLMMAPHDLMGASLGFLLTACCYILPYGTACLCCSITYIGLFNRGEWANEEGTSFCMVVFSQFE